MGVTHLVPQRTSGSECAETAVTGPGGIGVSPLGAPGLRAPRSESAVIPSLLTSGPDGSF